jgi:hypothetical protein
VRFLAENFIFSILPALIVNRENSDFLIKISEKLSQKIFYDKAALPTLLRKHFDKIGD